MPSVLKSRVFRGGPISLAAVSELERRNFPVSIRDLITVRSKTFRVAVTAGDVSADIEFLVLNTGNWSTRVTLHDDGDIAGDSFLLDLLLDGTPGHGTSFDGELGKGDTQELRDQGIDAFLREHFDQIQSLTAKLHATPDLSILTAVVIALTGLGAVVFFTQPGGPVRVDQCPDAPFGEHEPCIRITRPPPPPPGGPPPGGIAEPP